MRIARVLSCCLPLAFTVPVVRADDGDDRDGRKEIQEKIEKIIHEAKDAESKGEKERAEDLTKLAHQIEESVKKHVDEAQAKVKEAIQKALRDADKAKERGEREIAEKLGKKAQKPKEKPGKEAGREDKVRAVEEKLAQARKTRNQLREDGHAEEADKAQKEVDGLKKILAEISSGQGERKFEEDVRISRERKEHPDLFHGEDEHHESGDREKRVEIFRDDRRGPDRPRGGPEGVGPPGPPRAPAPPFPPRELNNQIEMLRHEIGELRNQLHHVEDLLEDLHRARAESSRRVQQGPQGGNQRGPAPEPRRGRFESFEVPVPASPAEPGVPPAPPAPPDHVRFERRL